MKHLILPLTFLLLSAPSFAQQGPAYIQPMSPFGGALRPSQFWIDPTGQNDSDCDAQAWEDFTLAQTTTMTTVRWWGDPAPSLGFEISFYNQDPNTTAVQPDLAGPFATELHPTVTQTAVGSLFRFEAQLITPQTFQANTRYFISITGQTPVFCAYWNWAQSPAGTYGTFWWQRGLHMYFNLADNRAVALASAAGWPTGDAFCFGDGSSIPCPCNNPSSSPGRGCNNSSATGGAILLASGNPSLSSDTLLLTTTDEKPTAASLLLQGTAQLPSGAIFGQGIRCVAGTLHRLYLKIAVAGSITAPSLTDPTVSARSAALGDTIPSGAHRYYGVYYRDPTMLGTCTPANGFNITQQLDILWTP